MLTQIGQDFKGRLGYRRSLQLWTRPNPGDPTPLLYLPGCVLKPRKSYFSGALDTSDEPMI